MQLKDWVPSEYNSQLRHDLPRARFEESPIVMLTAREHPFSPTRSALEGQPKDLRGAGCPSALLVTLEGVDSQGRVPLVLVQESERLLELGSICLAEIAAGVGLQKGFGEI